MRSRQTIARRILAAPLAVALLVLAAPSCDDVDPIAETEWTLDVSANPASLTLAPGASGTSVITAVLLDENGVPQDGIGVRFTTSSGSLASGGTSLRTDSNGVVRDTLTTDRDATVTVRSGTLTQTVEVLVNPEDGPTAFLDINPPFEASAGSTVTFSGAASEGDITTYTFGITSDSPDPGQPNPDTVTGSNPVITRTYNTPQFLTIRLEVTDTNGLKDTTSDIYDIIANAAPNATITPISQTGSVSTSPTYTCQATVSACASTDPNGSITAYEIAWADGSVELSFGAAPCAFSHTWTTPAVGGRSIAVTVYDDGDKSSAACTNPASQDDLTACGSRRSDTGFSLLICPAS